MKKVLFLILILTTSFLFNLCFACNTKKDNIMRKKTIAIDLDGVLNEYIGQYKENKIPDIKNGAKEFLATLSKDYNLILFTTRNTKDAKNWLMENNIHEYFLDITNVKPLAYIYLDDRAVKFNGDYDETLYNIKNYKVYWK